MKSMINIFFNQSLKQSSILKIFIVLSSMVILFFAGCSIPAKRTEDKKSSQVEIKSFRVPEAITDIINPHFTGKYCEECHEKTPVKGAENFLKFGGDFTQLCKCHNYTPGSYIHPVDLRPSEEKTAYIPAEFPLPDGKITCLTCHDIYKQCKDNPILRRAAEAGSRFYKAEIKFLRGAPYQRRTDLCFRCHDEERYKQFDPHKQLDIFGEIIVESCLFCHLEKPDENTATFEDIKLIGNITMLCLRCHRQFKKHPSNVNHFLKPSDKILRRMKAIKTVFGVTLPLDSDGENTKGAGGKLRLRLSGDLCRYCHGM